MLVQFVTDQEYSSHGFSAKFYHTAINPICRDWLNISARYLTTSDHSAINCSFVITASIGSTISIQFELFKVKVKINMYYLLYCLLILRASLAYTS